MGEKKGETTAPRVSKQMNPVTLEGAAYPVDKLQRVIQKPANVSVSGAIASEYDRAVPR